MIASSPKTARACWQSGSSWPRCAPSLLTARARATSSLTINRHPWRWQRARRAGASRFLRAGSRDFSRYCNMAAPASRIRSVAANSAASRNRSQSVMA